MALFGGKTVSKIVVILLAISACSGLAAGQVAMAQEGNHIVDPVTVNELLTKIDQLVQQNRQLEKQNQNLMGQIESMRQFLVTQSDSALRAEATARALRQAVADETQPKVTSASLSLSRNRPEASVAYVSPATRPAPRPGTSAEPTNRAQGDEGQRNWGTYTPNQGFKLANTEHGDLNLSIYSYARYLNQKGLEPTYTNAFGVTSTLQQRQDFQLNKVQIKFLGWIGNPKFRYFLYAWTSNASMGLPAQVVLAGNLNYTFNNHFAVGSGIFSLPGTRSVEGNFPFWLGVDTRLIADEYMRPSYSSGVKASGMITPGLIYQSMIANNLSTLGVSAAQLPNYFKTNANSLVWMPTTHEFGAGFGDFERHERLATRFAAHYTRSQENKQSQPGTDEPENTQLRLSDGSIIFTPNLFGPGISITDAKYRMTAFDGGLKYHGYSLSGEFYLHWLSDFKGTQTEGLHSNFDRGYQLQASAMLLPKTLQAYAGGSEVIGNFGRPWDFRMGVNYFPYRSRVLRWNSEYLYLYRSPVGYTSVPFAVGGTGPVFHTNLELAF